MTFNKRFFSFGLLVSCVAALGYGGYVYSSEVMFDDTSQDEMHFKILGQHLVAKIPEGTSEKHRKYMRPRGSELSPGFPIALGDYSSGTDYYKKTGLYAPDGPFYMRMRLHYLGDRGSAERRRESIRSFRKECKVTDISMDLILIQKNENSNCNKSTSLGYDIYYLSNPALDDFPTRIRCQSREFSTCNMSIMISDEWDLRGTFKIKHLVNITDVRDRLLNYTKNNIKRYGQEPKGLF